MASILVLAVPVASGDLYTPLVASAFQQRTIPVLGTDGQLHVVYELTAVNTRPGTATLERVAVADGAGPDRALGSFAAKALGPRIRTLDKLDQDVVDFGG
jgi:hypothetical protein